MRAYSEGAAAGCTSAQRLLPLVLGEPDERDAIDKLKRKWNSAPLGSLLRWLYKTYPDTAANTVLTRLKAT